MSQIESGYYPAGAEFDSNAPWNRDDTKHHSNPNYDYDHVEEFLDWMRPLHFKED